MNRKKRVEQLFILTVMTMGCFGLLCVSGCGGDGCECVKAGAEWDAETKVVGASIPGCGGLLSSGKGCDSPIWSQATKVMAGCSESGCVLGCDNQYFGEEKGCLGCSKSADMKSCYSGISITDSDNWGIFIGGTDSKARALGCNGGKSGCEISENILEDDLKDLENELGIQ